MVGSAALSLEGKSVHTLFAFEREDLPPCRVFLTIVCPSTASTKLPDNGDCGVDHRCPPWPLPAVLSSSIRLLASVIDSSAGSRAYCARQQIVALKFCKGLNPT